VFSLSNWVMDTVTQPQQDIGSAYRILSTGKKPRLVTALSVYSGTNTAASSNTYWVIPSQPAASGDEYDLGTQNAVMVFHNTGNMSVGTSAALSFAMATDRGGAGGLAGLLIPPGYILLAAPRDANLNGTMVHNIASVELDYA